MVYQEWLRVDGDMKRQADASHQGNKEGTGGDICHRDFFIEFELIQNRL